MEKMTDFFTARVQSYDEHMLNCVKGCKEAYKYMATLVAPSTEEILDLGCGTGLELEDIFKLLPDVNVTGIDLTPAMLEKLKNKYPNKNLKLICGSYFDVPLGNECFDCAISFQTMHHFSHEKKAELYSKIYNSLKPGCFYIECDYMVEHQAEEDFYFSENSRIRKKLMLSDSEFYHYDTPCTIENQTTLLYNAGFQKVDRVFRIENTTILVSSK